jgi:hypothetical protein
VTGWIEFEIKEVFVAGNVVIGSRAIFATGPNG